MGQTRGPVVHAENPIRYRHHPVVEWGFFEIGNTVEASGHPVAGCQHVASDLGLDCVHVIHETRRAPDVYQEDAASGSDDEPTRTEEGGISTPISCRTNPRL